MFSDIMGNKVPLAKTFIYSFPSFFAYGGREWWATQEALQELNILNQAAVLPMALATVISRMYIMVFTRAVAVYADVKGKETREDKEIAELTGCVKTAGTVAGYLSVVNGIVPAVLLCYIGTETLMKDLFGTKSPWAVIPVYFATLLSTWRSYKSFSYKQHIANFTKTLNALYNKELSATVFIFGILTSIPWAIATIGLFQYKFEEACKGIGNHFVEDEIVELPQWMVALSWALAGNFLFCRYMGRIGEVFRLLTEGHKYASVDHEAQHDITGKQVGVTAMSVLMGTIYLVNMAFGFFIGSVKFLENTWDPDETHNEAVYAIAAVLTACALTLDYCFNYRKSMTKAFKIFNIAALRPEYTENDECPQITGKCLAGFFALSSKLRSVATQVQDGYLEMGDFPRRIDEEDDIYTMGLA